VIAGAAAQDGTISMESAPDVISGAHDLLLSAACSAIHRQRVFRSRRNDLAVEFVKNLTLRCQCAAKLRYLLPSTRVQGIERRGD
jgi:hypothetical protein